MSATLAISISALEGIARIGLSGGRPDVNAARPVRPAAPHEQHRQPTGERHRAIDHQPDQAERGQRRLVAQPPASEQGRRPDAGSASSTTASASPATAMPAPSTAAAGLDGDKTGARGEPDQQHEIDPGADRGGEREADLRVADPSAGS